MGLKKIPTQNFSDEELALKPKIFNTVKGDVSDSELNVGGGQFDTTLEMNEGVPSDPMLLKVIWKPIKVMITC